jgi:hypothetical protein
MRTETLDDSYLVLPDAVEARPGVVVGRFQLDRGHPWRYSPDAFKA